MPSIEITKISGVDNSFVDIPEPIKDIYNSNNIDEAIDKINNKYKGINVKNIGAI